MNTVTEISHFKSYADNYRFVSFDIFDTLIKREFLKVNEVHDTVSAYALSLVGRRDKGSPFDLTLLRYRMSDALKKFDGSGTQEPLLRDVWERILAREVDDADTRSKFADLLTQFELDLEIANLRLVDGALKLLQDLRNQGKTLIAISDMYFSKNEMEVILGNLGILDLFHHLYVSADSKLTKQSGDLFKTVLVDLDISAGEIIHAGDNRVSDIEMSSKLGIRGVFVNQSHLLDINRPKYGARFKVEEDIADLVKMHLSFLYFDAIDKKTEHVYFLARDGCAIHDFSRSWMAPPWVKSLSVPPSSILYLNRVLTCWGGVDFSGDWLVQSIGLVFWLNHGEASPGEMCERLGIAEVPPALGTEMLRPQHDTFRIANILVQSGLDNTARAEVERKKSLVLRYLRGTGFFENRAVAFSDVGYSGTVARDISTLFLLSPDFVQASPPPAMRLHLIATNDNFAQNRSRSAPFCEFSEGIVLHSRRIPENLKASFSWLEFFFKHRTLRPILAFSENGDVVEPVLQHDEPTPAAMPAERVARFAAWQDADIVLLWLAAINFPDQVVDPIIDRFANPDDDTIRQMGDEVFELHSIQGSKRSIILKAPAARPEAIARAAQEGDYWIPGSIVASRSLSKTDDSEPPQATQRRTLVQKLAKALNPKRPNRPAPPNQLDYKFDPNFYREFYPDLRHLNNDEELFNHFINHGRAEARVCNFEALQTELTAQFGLIPADFDPVSYLMINADVAAEAGTPGRALEHYMRTGQHEGRAYQFDRKALRHDFDALVTAGRVVLDLEEQKQRDAGTPALDLFLNRHGIFQGPWIDQIRPAEFRALNSSWAGHVETTAECVVALLERGMGQTPALSLSAQFDEGFYRAEAGLDADIPAAELYRHYVSTGSSRGLFPCEQMALQQLWGHTDFPDEFDWEGYASQLGLSAEAINRVNLLRRFVESSGTDRLKFIAPSASGRLLEFLAMRAWHRDGRPDDAKQFLLEGLASSQNAGLFNHRLGDLALQSGDRRQALLYFRSGVDSPTPDRWSFINAAQLLLDEGDHLSAWNVLLQGEQLWQQRAPWRRLRDRALSMRCGSALHDLRLRNLDAADLASADQLFADIRSTLPATTALCGSGRGVLVLTMRAASSARRDRIIVDGVTVYDLLSIEEEDYLGALLAHEIVIFHEVPFTYPVLRAISLARGIGRRCVAWLGDLADWEGFGLSHCEWDNAGYDRSPLGLAQLGELVLPSRYCDEVHTSLAGCIPLLSALSHQPGIQYHAMSPGIPEGPHRGRRKQVFVVPIPGISGSDVRLLAAMVRNAAEQDPDFHFLVQPQIAEAPDLGKVAGRWSLQGDNPDLASIAQTIASSDCVLQIVGRREAVEYAGWIEAAANKVPAIALLRPDPDGAARSADEGGIGTDWPETLPLSEAGRIAPLIAQAIADKADRPSSRIWPAAAPVASAEFRPNRQPAPTKPRILIANTFFPPQLIGGAARVVKDNVDFFLDHAAGEFDLAVTCADEQNDQPGEWRMDGYRGIPVFRLATPQELNMDWRGANGMVGARFAAVLRAVKPDLVHIHCLQRLGVAVAEICRDQGIPYLVTLHDGWWLSDFPFLTGPAGERIEVFADYRMQQQLAGVGADASLNRAGRLRSALMGARERLAVSQSFADLHESCGIPCRVIENGTPRLPPLPRRTAPDERVHLCHVGGLEHHKGAYLIEAALTQSRFENLHFTVVDLARNPGEETRTMWGATPVTITGKMTPAQLAEFYARMNVLIAPSTWPESYGLVTREAADHGLWIIAGDRGAMADPVKPGVNGFKVDVSDANDLLGALKAVNENPSLYRTSPPGNDRRRTADDQSTELWDLYKSFFRN